MRVAVTGATGHIGANLVRALIDRGDEVVALVRHPSLALEGLPIRCVSGDVLDAASLAEAFEGAEVVFHLAAVISITGDQGGLVTRTNVEGARNAATAARTAGVRRFVHVASVHAFEMAPLDQPVDETRARAFGAHHAAYDRSKALGEQAVRGVEGLDAVILHPSGVIGPADFRPSRVGQFFLDLYHRRLPALTPGGFDWVDVRDVVAGILAAADRGRAGESYILSGTWHSMVELAAMASKVTGVPAPRWRSPMWLARTGAPFMTAFNRVTGIEPLYTTEALDALEANRRLLHHKAARELGHAPRAIPETVADLCAWFRQQGWLR